MGDLRSARAAQGTSRPGRRAPGAGAEAAARAGDATGLARTSAALADYLLAAGRPGDALQALAGSIAFNIDKGSPIGLAFNRRALAGLRHAIAPSGPTPANAGLLGFLEKVHAQLEAGERSYGRVHLAGEGG